MADGIIHRSSTPSVPVSLMAHYAHALPTTLCHVSGKLFNPHAESYNDHRMKVECLFTIYTRGGNVQFRRRWTETGRKNVLEIGGSQECLPECAFGWSVLHFTEGEGALGGDVSICWQTGLIVWWGQINWRLLVDSEDSFTSLLQQVWNMAAFIYLLSLITHLTTPTTNQWTAVWLRHIKVPARLWPTVLQSREGKRRNWVWKKTEVEMLTNQAEWSGAGSSRASGKRLIDLVTLCFHDQK